MSDKYIRLSDGAEVDILEFDINPEKHYIISVEVNDLSFDRIQPLMTHFKDNFLKRFPDLPLQNIMFVPTSYGKFLVDIYEINELKDPNKTQTQSLQTIKG